MYLGTMVYQHPVSLVYCHIRVIYVGMYACVDSQPCLTHVLRAVVLFHRAILMSGSALSPWAMIPDPVHVTVRLAKALNCSMSNDGVLLECLRSKSVHELVNVDFQVGKAGADKQRTLVRTHLFLVVRRSLKSES